MSMASSLGDDALARAHFAAGCLQRLDPTARQGSPQISKHTRSIPHGFAFPRTVLLEANDSMEQWVVFVVGRPDTASDWILGQRLAPFPRKGAPDTGRVHRYVVSCLERVSLRYFSNQLVANKRVLFCGYDIGGAVAAAMALQLRSCCSPEHADRVYCVTFGTPLFADQALAAELNALGDRMMHIYLQGDIIPNLLTVAVEFENAELKKQAVTSACSDLYAAVRGLDATCNVLREALKDYALPFEYAFGGSALLLMGDGNFAQNQPRKLHEIPKAAYNDRNHSITYYFQALVASRRAWSVAIRELPPTIPLLVPRVENVTISVDAPGHATIQLDGSDLWFPLAIKLHRSLFQTPQPPDTQIVTNVCDSTGAMVEGHYLSKDFTLNSKASIGHSVQVITMFGEITLDTPPTILLPLLQPQSPMSWIIAGMPSSQVIEATFVSSHAYFETLKHLGSRAVSNNAIARQQNLLTQLEILDELWSLVDIRLVWQAVTNKRTSCCLSSVATRVPEGASSPSSTSVEPDMWREDSILVCLENVVRECYQFARDRDLEVAADIFNWVSQRDSQFFKDAPYHGRHKPNESNFFPLPMQETRYNFGSLWDETNHQAFPHEDTDETALTAEQRLERQHAVAQAFEDTFNRGAALLEVVQVLMDEHEERPARALDRALASSVTAVAGVLDALSFQRFHKLATAETYFSRSWYWSRRAIMSEWENKLWAAASALEMTDVLCKTTFFIEQKLHRYRSRRAIVQGQAERDVKFDFGALSSSIFDPSEVTYWKQRLNAFAHVGASVYSLRAQLAQRVYTVAVFGAGNSGKSCFGKLAFGLDTRGGHREANRTKSLGYYTFSFGNESTGWFLDFPGSDEVVSADHRRLVRCCVGLASVVVFCFSWDRFNSNEAVVFARTYETLQRYNIPFLVCVTFADQHLRGFDIPQLEEAFQHAVDAYNSKITAAAACKPLEPRDSKSPTNSFNICLANFSVRQPRAVHPVIMSAREVRGWIDRFLGQYQTQPVLEDHWKFELSEDVKTFDDIDSGSLGRVLGARFNESENEIAAKELFFISNYATLIQRTGNTIPAEVREQAQAEFLHQCYILSRLRHKNIVAFRGVAFAQAVPQFSTPQYLLMDRHPTSLEAELLRNQAKLPLERVFDILIGVAEALLYLHSQIPPVLHLDVKPSNILLASDGTAKLSDLGEAHIIRRTDIASEKYSPNSLDLTSTPLYMAPEMESRESEKSAKTDMFSFGCLVVELLGRHALSAPLTSFVAVPEGFTPVPSPHRSPDALTRIPLQLRDFAHSLLLDCQAQRRSAGQVREFLVGFNASTNYSQLEASW